jgi:nucleotide-binding universal stress UspA family protein
MKALDWIGGRRPAPPDPSSLKIRRILIASEGRPIPQSVLNLAMRLASAQEEGKASVRVFSVARIYGTSLGLPTPGLLPTRKEWEAQRMQVKKAVETLKKRGFRSEAQVLATRNPTKHILRYAKANYCDVIIMAADPPRHPLRAEFMWSQEAYRVERNSPVPVYIVEQSQATRKTGGARGVPREARVR